MTLHPPPATSRPPDARSRRSGDASRGKEVGGGKHIPGETLLLFTIAKAGDVLILQSTWSTSADLRSGRRRTQTDLVPDLETLHGLIDRLVPLLCRPPGG